MKHLKFIKLSGEEVKPYLKYLGYLRIQLFREYPYLYDGDIQYEEKYLQNYVKCPDSRLMMVADGEKIIGATTSIPLKDEDSELREPFIRNHWNVNEVFYLGEALLLPQYRGQGIYRQFFDFRENAAREQGYSKTAFISVIRPEEHPAKPKDYQPLDSIWRHFDYHPQPELIVHYSWKDVGESDETEKPLMVWIKNL